jgi:hypothetical protein
MKYSALAIKSVVVWKRSPRLPQWRRGLLLASCAATLACLAFPQTVRAVIPAPDGGYPNGNTAEGTNALFDLDTNNSSDNTALGNEAMDLTDIASGNTAVGSFTMEFCAGDKNVGIGEFALFQVSGDSNTGVGSFALGVDISGANNTAVGEGAVGNNVSGNSNTGVGFNALGSNTGSSNIAIGESAGFNLTNGKNNIDIGNTGTAGESAKIRIGNKAHKSTFIAGIRGVTVAGGIGVIIDTNGQLGTVSSSRRFKDDIKPMDKASEALLSLHPVTFRYKKELDPVGIPQFGLVAEDVAKVDPDLVAKDEDGKVYSVRYEAVNAMLLNEFLKAHKALAQETNKNRAQEETIGELKAAVAREEREIQNLTTNLQKISEDLALRKPTPRVVTNDR